MDDKAGGFPGPTSHSYFSQRLRLHYVDWGNPEVAPLLMVHGGRDHCRNWDWVAQSLRQEWHVIAPDLRGHGDSQWMVGGAYQLHDYTYDIAQLLDQTGFLPVNIVAHSLGGAVSMLYAGLRPENVRRLVVIEGWGWTLEKERKRHAAPVEARVGKWLDRTRSSSGRQPRRYPSIENAFHRMQEANPHLTPEQARHLTVHGVNRNEDGTYSWKFDNYTRISAPFGLPEEDRHALWSRITCPTLLVRGTESWASDPQEDGRVAHFADVRVASMKGAGHWVHHDQLDNFLALTREFLAD